MHSLIRKLIKTGGVFVVSGFLRVVGASCLLWMLWPRLRAVGSHLRHAQGERF